MDFLAIWLFLDSGFRCDTPGFDCIDQRLVIALGLVNVGCSKLTGSFIEGSAFSKIAGDPCRVTGAGMGTC